MLLINFDILEGWHLSGISLRAQFIQYGPGTRRGTKHIKKHSINFIKREICEYLEAAVFLQSKLIEFPTVALPCLAFSRMISIYEFPSSNMWDLKAFKGSRIIRTYSLLLDSSIQCIALFSSLP